jgi:hypothetical protein
MVARVKDRAVVMAVVIVGAAEAGTIAVTFLVKAAWAKAAMPRAAKPALPQPPGPPSTTLELGPSTCTLIQL